MATPRMDSFTRAYFEAALWASSDESNEQGGEPLDKNYDISDFDPATRDKMIADCVDFQEKFAEQLAASGLDDEKAGHDFWLSRNGHGSGFFDDEDEEGNTLDELQDAAESYGEFYLYLGDPDEDGERLIYGPPPGARKEGYWHAQGPGSRTGVSKLPSDARSIGGHGGRRAAEAPLRVASGSEKSETELISQGRCPWETATGMPGTTRCGRRVEKGHLYCAQHERDWLDLYPHKPIPMRHRHSVRDYEAIDRQDRVIAGPFKSYGDAKDAAGSAGAVRFVPSRGKKAEVRAPRADKTQAAFRRLDHFFGSPTAQRKGFSSEDEAAASAATLLAAQMRMSYGTALKIVHEWYRQGGVTEASRGARRAPRAGAKEAGAAYAQDQIGSDHFMDWVRSQMLEASKSPPEDVLPLETKSDALKVARNMLQQLEWDTRRELRSDEIASLIGDGDVKEFWEGFREATVASREWLADELLEIKGGGGGGITEASRRVGEDRRTVELYNLFRPGSQSPSNGYMVRVVSNGQTRFVKFGRHSDKAAAFARGVAPEPSKEEQERLELDVGPTRPKARGSARRRR